MFPSYHTPRPAERLATPRTEVFDNVIRVSGRIMMHGWGTGTCPKSRGRGPRRQHAFISQKQVFFIRDGRINIVKTLLELADATCQALNLRRVLLFDMRRDRAWGVEVSNGKLSAWVVCRGRPRAYTVHILWVASPRWMGTW